MATTPLDWLVKAPPVCRKRKPEAEMVTVPALRKGLARLTPEPSTAKVAPLTRVMVPGPPSVPPVQWRVVTVALAEPPRMPPVTVKLGKLSVEAWLKATVPLPTVVLGAE